ncbi:hypothetical protein PILCRDRAFT_63566 [Piloderma croceum F 1598]|uniref:Kinase n=1 Tax=Piloderma croceum (strain F 1598) TaxID=765440 RepID=A0A0C3CCB5_PILCF|nr:hypothetical protein PILCRDRAFT_63566 [Piloderma croceum F 1598]
MSSWTSSPLPLSSQVGGHPGILATEDGSLIIKKALPLELEFYQTHALDPAFGPLRPFLPKFYGTLKLEGEVDGLNTDPLVSIVLENLAYPFSKPNILDIKLGTVHDNNTSLPVVTPKTYGKSIKVADLPDGIARFFPVASSPSLSSDPTKTSIRSFGLPKSILLPILESLREDITELLEAFQEVHLCIVGGSLLIIYEGDWERAAEGVKRFLFDDENSNESGGKKRSGPPYTLSLIDFAHTRVTPGQGPSQGVLLGLSTVRKLLDGRIEQVRHAEV